MYKARMIYIWLLIMHSGDRAGVGSGTEEPFTLYYLVFFTEALMEACGIYSFKD